MEDSQQAQTEMKAALASLVDDIMLFLSEIDKTEALLHELAARNTQRTSTQRTAQ